MNSNNRSEIFLKVIEDNKGILYKVANSYCRDPTDREDLIQEMIFQLWRSFDNYDSEYKLSTWIYRISLNVAISFYRKEKSRDKLSYPLTDEILNYSVNILESGSYETEEKEADLNLLQKFIKDQRSVIIYSPPGFGKSAILKENNQKQKEKLLNQSDFRKLLSLL
jgi:RNA polymerase sigma-70 factor (ECF subfamily)